MDAPFFCDMNALTEQQRSRHAELARQLRPAVVEFIELPNGYKARFEPASERALQIAEFITLERLCCPFFTLGLEIEKEGGPMFFIVTGGDGVKPFIRAEFGIPGNGDDG